jgi:protein-L-isoaspartate(D-aspartate) O-methyltransferase
MSPRISSSYVTAVLHHLVSEGGAQGRVVGIEHISELVAFSVANLQNDGLGPALADGQIHMVDGDGRKGARGTIASISYT